MDIFFPVAVGSIIRGHRLKTIGKKPGEIRDWFTQ